MRYWLAFDEAHNASTYDLRPLVRSLARLESRDVLLAGFCKYFVPRAEVWLAWAADESESAD